MPDSPPSGAPRVFWTKIGGNSGGGSCGRVGPLRHRWRTMAPAPAPAPAPATVPPPALVMDVKDEVGGGAKNHSSLVVVKSEDVCTDGGPLVLGTELVKHEGGDTTESSSSFGGTCSGFEGEADDGEPEVNSSMSTHVNGVRLSKSPRRKKVTTEWIDSVRPIKWRCHWLELRMRELSSQVSKYDKELALIKKQKELQQAASKANGTISESMQIQQGCENSIIKRRKRKRHEEYVDASLYISKHRILSYYLDKQNKGAETNDLIIDDGCDSTVNGSIRGGLDTITLLDSEDYEMIYEQRTLQDILLTIDGVQSRVHLLQDCLSKAHSKGEILASSGGNDHVMVVPKRKRTQKRPFSYTEYRHTKPQKKKNLNILLKDDDGQALLGGPALPDRETGAHIEDASRSDEETSGERNRSREKAITLDLLLGTGTSITNSHIGDLGIINADDILIDNQAANEACLLFHKDKNLPSGASSKDRNISALVAEMKNSSVPVEADSTSTPVLEQESFLENPPSRKPVSPGNKQELKPKKKRKKKGSFFTNKRKEASKTPDSEEQAEGMPSAAENQRSTPSNVAKENTESTLSAATGPETMTACSSGNKHKPGNEPADAKKHRSRNSSLASKEQKTGKSSSAVKTQKTEDSSAAAKTPEDENASSPTKKQEAEIASSTEKKLEAASAPMKLQVEKAVLVAVNSRRSQRVRKPKVFAE